LALLDYAIHRDRRPSLLVVTDIDDARLKRASKILTVKEAAKNGVELVYLNTADVGNPVDSLLAYSSGEGFDDVFVFAPVPSVIAQGDAVLGYDGCLNFFAGPGKTDFTAPFNFYDVHYNATHIIGTSGGNTDDMHDAMELAVGKRINPAILVTHVGGLNAAKDATLNLPDIPGGKKLLYTHIDLPLTAITNFAEKGKADPLFAQLDAICKDHGGLWSREAEQHLLENAPELKI
jgi:threonine dehydrogenase-like Zn-dependent dehydrogenase